MSVVAPEEGPVDPHEHLRGQVVGLVQDDPYLGLAPSAGGRASPAPDPRPAWWGQRRRR